MSSEPFCLEEEKAVKEASWRQAKWFFVFCVLALLSALLFLNGVNDAFYFDDHSNLNALGNSGSIDNWESARQFIFGNASGPTGRPVSMASFLLNDNTWPTQASSFKITNIALHTINGFLLFWLVYLIVDLRTKQYSLIIAIFVACAWLFNPFHVSTVLYPVQRMTQLSALFSMLAIILYVKGRVNFSKGDLVLGWLLFLGVFVAFLLATFSKENAVLLPMMIGVIELWVIKYLAWPKKWIKWLSFTLISLGTVSVIGFLVYSVVSVGLFDQYSGRDFSPYQRIITQPGVLLFYIKELFLPALYTSGLYYDDYLAAESFFSSYAVVISAVILLTIFLISVELFRRNMLSGLAIMFFLVGHVLESSVLNLELVFEHRNYLPSIFLGFVWFELFSLAGRKSRVGWLVIIFPLIIYPLFLYERTSLWEDEVNFGSYLAVKSPNSIRSHVELNNALLYSGRLEEAKVSIDKAVGLNPDSLYLSMHAVLIDCLVNQPEQGNLNRLITLAKEQAFDGRNRLAFEKIYKYMNENRCDSLTPKYFSRLLSAFLERTGSQIEPQQGVSGRLLRIYADRFYINYPDHSPYDVVPIDRILGSRNPEYLMTVASQLASLSKYAYAMELSKKALELVREGEMGTSSRSQKMFERSILEFKEVVREDMAR